MSYGPEYSREISSPGLGTTEALLSRDPLATEGEATPGPDDEVPDDLADAEMGGPDPIINVNPGVPNEVELPTADIPTPEMPAVELPEFDWP